jgi:hypothetical protein
MYRGLKIEGGSAESSLHAVVVAAEGDLVFSWFVGTTPVRHGFTSCGGNV